MQRLCKCGCGEDISHLHKNRKYLNREHRENHYVEIKLCKKRVRRIKTIRDYLYWKQERPGDYLAIMEKIRERFTYGYLPSVRSIFGWFRIEHQMKIDNRFSQICEMDYYKQKG